MSSQVFGFVQFEFTHPIGPVAGRYVIAPIDGDEPGEPVLIDEDTDLGALPPAPRGDQLFGERRGMGSADVLVVSLTGADLASGRRLFARKPQSAEGEDTPAPAPLCLATVIRATAAHDSVAAADAWLSALLEDPAERDKVVAEGLWQLNLAVRAFRVGAGDPYMVEFTSEDPRTLRIGYGPAADVADGRWSRAYAIPPSDRVRESRAERLRPGELAAALLAGRLVFLEGEELLLIAHRELQQDRPRNAALSARAAVALLRKELGAAGKQLAAAGETLEATAAKALESSLTEDEQTALWTVLGDIAGILDEWRDSVATHAG